MYLLELVWITYTKDGFVSSKDATINVFSTEGEAVNKLAELFHFFYLKGDDYYRTLNNFKITSKRITGKMIYIGRISYLHLD